MIIKESDLLVKKSKLPAAGKGLFTKKAIPKGTRIAEYKGIIRKWKDVKTAEADNPYILFVNRNHVIDALPVKNAKARFANDAAGLNTVKGISNNSMYVTEGLRVYIQARKDIPAGSEILVGYGKEYWDTVKYNSKIK